MPLRGFDGIVGPDHVRYLEGEGLDGVPIAGEVSPGSPEEVAACLRLASQEARPLVVVGGASKIALGNRPDAERLVRLSTRRLGTPLEIQPDEGIAVAGAGVPFEEVRREAGALGRRGLVQISYPAATVGGTVAADPLDPTVPPLRDELLGIQVALANGTLTRAGGRVVKNVTGFDLVRLHCGAGGTLGVITEVTFRLRPLPEAECLLRLEAADATEALGHAAALLESGAHPDGILVRPEGDRLAIVWKLSGGAEEVRARAERFGGDETPRSTWEGAEEVLTRPPADAARVRVQGRLSDARESWTRFEAAGGVVRLAVPARGVVIGDLPEALATRAVRDLRSAGRVVVVERASSALKESLDVYGPLPDSLPLMRAVKARFDPARVLSPGRPVGRI